MVNVISCKCPECSAELSIEQDREFAFCSYCGAKIMIQNDNEKINRTIDEAALKRAELDYKIKMREMDREDKFHNLIKYAIIGYAGVFALVILIMIIASAVGNDSLETTCMLIAMYMFLGAMIGGMGYGTKRKDIKAKKEGKIKAPSTIADYEGKNYTQIQEELKRAGFTNIHCIGLNDLTTGLLNKPDRVESITVNGDESMSAGEWYYPDERITISYHSFR